MTCSSSCNCNGDAESRHKTLQSLMLHTAHAHCTCCSKVATRSNTGSQTLHRLVQTIIITTEQRLRCLKICQFRLSRSRETIFALWFLVLYRPCLVAPYPGKWIKLHRRLLGVARQSHIWHASDHRSLDRTNLVIWYTIYENLQLNILRPLLHRHITSIQEIGRWSDRRGSSVVTYAYFRSNGTELNNPYLNLYRDTRRGCGMDARHARLLQSALSTGTAI